MRDVVLPPEIHSLRCNCIECEPHAPSAPRFDITLQRIAVRAIAGLVLGQLLVMVYDAITGGPGAFAVFGL